MYEDLTKRAEQSNDPLVKELLAAVNYLDLELSGCINVKEQLGELLGCSDELRWKWILLETHDLIDIKTKYNALVAAKDSKSTKET